MSDIIDILNWQTTLPTFEADIAKGIQRARDLRHDISVLSSWTEADVDADVLEDAEQIKKDFEKVLVEIQLALLLLEKKHRRLA